METDITIPFVPGHPMLRGWIDYAVRMGFTTFKVKVSGDVAQDKKFLAELLGRLRGRVSGLAIRLDGNQGYTRKTFRQMADYIERAVTGSNSSSSLCARMITRGSLRS